VLQIPTGTALATPESASDLKLGAGPDLETFRACGKQTAKSPPPALAYTVVAMRLLPPHQQPTIPQSHVDRQRRR